MSKKGDQTDQDHIDQEWRSADPGIADEERRTIAEMMAQGTCASIN